MKPQLYVFVIFIEIYILFYKFGVKTTRHFKEWKLSNFKVYATTIFLSWFLAQEPSMQATWNIFSCVVYVVVLYL